MDADPGAFGMMELAVAAHLAGFAAALWYLFIRLGPYFTVSSIMVAALLVIHGPAYLWYVLAYGPDTFVFETVLGMADRERVLVELTFALGLTFFGVIAGIALANDLWSAGAGRLRRALREEADAAPAESFGNRRVLWALGIAVALVMFGVSASEQHAGKVVDFVLLSGAELDKAAVRREMGGSGLYAYNLLLYAPAPFLAIVLLRVAVRNPSPAAFVSTAALIGAVVLGKLATLSKAPAAIFLVQLLIVGVMARSLRIRVGWGVVLVAVTTVLFGAVSIVAIPQLGLDTVANFLFYRAFMIPNEVLVEYFSVVPDVIPHGWGAHFAGAAALFGIPFDPVPAYTAVAEVSRGSTDSSSNAMFLGDSWAEFGWVGVLLFPIAAGFVARAIDIYAFRRGKTEEAIALVAGATYGVFTLLVTALSTAFLSGGLLIVPAASWLLVQVAGPTRKAATVPERAP